VRVSATSVRTVLRRHHLGGRHRGAGRRPELEAFLRTQAAGTLACDFLNVETIGLTWLYGLFLIELEDRWRAHCRDDRHAGFGR
jgi:putative transposase